MTATKVVLKPGARVVHSFADSLDSRLTFGCIIVINFVGIISDE